MKFEGNIRKMKSQLDAVVQYYLPIGDDLVNMNELIGKPINFSFKGLINCKKCGRKTKKSFNQGFCFPCFNNAAESSPCIIRPELCEGHLGKGRDVEWEKAHHVQPHYVYLSLTSNIKIGVTRSTQIPTRWIDQGATQAAIVAEVPYRQLAGIIEVYYKDYFSDKTSWQKMLKGIAEEGANIDDAYDTLISAADELDEEAADYILDDIEVMDINYPLTDNPTKVKSIGFDKLPDVNGILTGIKGQYLIIDNEKVLNIRKHEGYYIYMP